MEKIISGIKNVIRIGLIFTGFITFGMPVDVGGTVGISTFYPEPEPEPYEVFRVLRIFT